MFFLFLFVVSDKLVFKNGEETQQKGSAEYSEQCVEIGHKVIESNNFDMNHTQTDFVFCFIKWKLPYFY